MKTFDLENMKALFSYDLKMPEDQHSVGFISRGNPLEKQKLIYLQENGAVRSTVLVGETVESLEVEDLFQATLEEEKKCTRFLSLGNSSNSAVVLGQMLGQVWDVEHKKEVWKAKNLPNDELNLEIPMWDTSGCFY